MLVKKQESVGFLYTCNIVAQDNEYKTWICSHLEHDLMTVVILYNFSMMASPDLLYKLYDEILLAMILITYQLKSLLVII